MRIHVRFAMRPGERGHLNTALAMARRLAADGLVVDFVGAPADEKYVVDQGFGFRVIEGSAGPDDVSCDLLIVDQAMQPAAMVAAVFEQPFLTLSITLPDSRSVPPIWSAAIPGDTLLLNARTRALRLAERLFAAPYRKIRVLNLPELSPWNATVAEHCQEREVALRLIRQSRRKTPVLVACPADFDFPAAVEQAPDHVHYIEPCVDLGRKGPAWSWPDFENGTVRICAALGSTQLSALDTLIENLFALMRKRGDWRLVCSSMPRGTSAADVPRNVKVMEYFPQIQVLAQASVMITHCGLNSVKEAIVQGVPMIGVPARRDQPSVGARLQLHGLGCLLDANATPDQLEAMVSKVSADPDIATNVKAMQARFEAATAEAPGASKIIQMASQRFANQ